MVFLRQLAPAQAIIASLLITPPLAAQDRPPTSFGIFPDLGRCNVMGVPVGVVEPDATGAALGLRPGDVIVETNHSPIRSDADLVRFVRAMRAGDSLVVTVLRDGRTVTLTGTAISGGPPPAMTIRRPGGAAGAAVRVTAEEARHTVLEFARLVEANYFDPVRAGQYAEALRSRAAAGAYDDAATAGVLAEGVSADIQSVAPEGHLRLLAGGSVQPAPRPTPINPAAEAAVMEPGPGKDIEVARWLAPGIAYVRLVRFTSDPALAAAVTKFMQDHAGAKTILFDLRGNSGGTTRPTDTILPYLFPRPTPLLRFDVRASAAARLGGLPPSPTERGISSSGDVLTREYYVSPHQSERRLFDATVFVLTSGRTASAAEHFAFALQASGRGRVIGEKTAGAGNYSFFGYEPVGTAFRAFVPNGRPYDPRTGRGWEVTGVTPDLPVPANAALREALIRSGLRPAEAERVAANIPCATPTFTITRPGG